MTKKDVKEHLEKSANELTYIADELTKSGYGQTVGGYHNEARKHGIEKPTQKWHFTVSYYDYKNAEKNPTYSRLHCPELLIWIAEVAGLDKTVISKAKDYIICFEEEHQLMGTEKNGNYIRPIETEFKKILHMGEINKIICHSTNWDEVIKNVSMIK